MCFVNSQNVRDLRQPFGGTKASGTGREGGTPAGVTKSAFYVSQRKNGALALSSGHRTRWAATLGRVTSSCRIGEFEHGTKAWSAWDNSPSPPKSPTCPACT